MASARPAASAPPTVPDADDEPPKAESPEPGAVGAEASASAEKAPTPFEYTWGDPTQYPHIPLTAYPPRPAEPAVTDESDAVVRDAVPARPATVFAFTEPPDGRWRPTDKPVNQAPDNQAPLAAEGA